jgi:hypothetical protein
MAAAAQVRRVESLRPRLRMFMRNALLSVDSRFTALEHYECEESLKRATAVMTLPMTLPLRTSKFSPGS